MWQVEPSVIFGRNQLIENEVNLNYCREHHIKMFRRKSGGGCVYADEGNVMLSFVTSNTDVGTAFNKFLTLITDSLRQLGADATATGRNDILIGGRKVSGSAFYRSHGRSIVHSTMLYDTNMQNMVGSITPDTCKLQSKGVESVRQHITLLKDHIGTDIAGLMEHVKSSLCTDHHRLTTDDISSIEQLEQHYLSPDFIYGNNPKYTAVRKARIDGVGNVEVRMELKNNVIKDINLVGDYFIMGDIDGSLLLPLRNVRLDRDSLDKVIPPNTEQIVMNLRRDDLIALIAGHGM